MPRLYRENRTEATTPSRLLKPLRKTLYNRAVFQAQKGCSRHARQGHERGAHRSRRSPRRCRSRYFRRPSAVFRRRIAGRHGEGKPGSRPVGAQEHRVPFSRQAHYGQSGARRHQEGGLGPRSRHRHRHPRGRRSDPPGDARPPRVARRVVARRACEAHYRGALVRLGLPQRLRVALAGGQRSGSGARRRRVRLSGSHASGGGGISEGQPVADPQRLEQEPAGGGAPGRGGGFRRRAGAGPRQTRDRGGGGRRAQHSDGGSAGVGQNDAGPTDPLNPAGAGIG